MSPDNSAPDRRPGVVAPLPARVEQGTTTRRQRQMVFEQVRSQVLEMAIRNFDQSLRVLRSWIGEDR